MGTPHPETEAGRARCSPLGSRARAGLGIAARRPHRPRSPGRGSPPGPGKLKPNRSPGPPAYLPHPGGGSPRGHGLPASAPAGRREQRRSGKQRAPFPPRFRAADSLPHGGEGRPGFPTGPRAPGRGSGLGPGCLLRPRCPAPGAHSNLKSWSRPRERACLRLLATVLRSRPFRDLASSRRRRGSECPFPWPESGSSEEARRGEAAGQGRGGGWAA